MTRWRVVVDTNVLISGFVYGGNSRGVLDSIFSHHNIFVSPDLLDEYRDTPGALEADLLITGDKDLLEVERTYFPSEIHDLRIVTPQQFLKVTSL